MYLIKNKSFKKTKRLQKLYLDKIVMEKLDITIYN